MAFLDLRFPDDISYGASSGPEYSTDIVVIGSGYEQRNSNWLSSRWSADVSHGIRTEAQIATLIAFFRIAKGKANNFRVKDWVDFTAVVANGRLGTTAIGTGTPTYQLYKRYSNAAGSEDRKITRPVTAITCYKTAVAITVGAAAGNIAINYSTGLITFVAYASSGATAITVGATTVVTLTTNPNTLIAGKKLYLSGFTGADAALVNGLAHTINSVSGTGPFVFTLATVTTGKVITFTGGNGYAYPQASDALTWAGDFDIPARFDTDVLKGEHIASGVYGWQAIPLIEVRE